MGQVKHIKKKQNQIFGCVNSNTRKIQRFVKIFLVIYKLFILSLFHHQNSSQTPQHNATMSMLTFSSVCQLDKNRYVISCKIRFVAQFGVFGIQLATCCKKETLEKRGERMSQGISSLLEFIFFLWKIKKDHKVKIPFSSDLLDSWATQNQNNSLIFLPL